MSSSTTDRMPGLTRIRNLRAGDLRGEIAAGVAVAALLVPHGMAYAELAGVPAVHGLYTTVVGLVVYALVGPSRLLMVGPDSSLAPLIAAAVVVVGADDDPGQAVATAGMLAVLAGGLCLAAGLLCLGGLAELLSKPTRIGYLNGLAVVMVVSQLPPLLGFGVDADTTLGAVADGWRAVADGAVDARSATVGVACVVALLALARWATPMPGVLLTVVAATVVVAAAGLDDRGVGVIGDVPTGFPTPSWPDVTLGDLPVLLASALGIAALTLSDTTALSTSFADRTGDEVDPDREMTALGVTNAAVGVFSGFPVSASTTRTTVAWQAGGRTQLVGVVGAALVAALLIFGGGLIERLPEVALAAVVIVAAVHLFDLSTLVWMRSVRPSEFLLASAATVGVVVLGVLEGIAVAVGLSLVNFVRRLWRPYDAVLGRVEGRKGYHDLERHPDARQIPGLLLFRFDAPLFFANAAHFSRRLRAALDAADGVRHVVVAAEPISDVDTTGAEVLERLLDELDRGQITFGFAEMKGPVKDRLRRYGLYERIGDDEFHPTLGTAIDAYLDRTNTPWTDWTDRTDG